MQRLLVVLLSILTCATARAQSEDSAAPTAWRTSLGLGLESRLSREINPDYVEVQNLPKLYFLLRHYPYGLSVELGEESRTSRAGALKINTSSTQISFWGRYEFSDHDLWVPFMAVGLGSTFEKVISEYGSSTDEREGLRKSAGLSAGLSATIWRFVEVEGEGRAVFIEDRKDPQLAALLKLGFRLH